MVISKIRTEKDSNLHKIKEVTKATKPQPTSKHLDTKIIVHRMNTYPNGWGGGGGGTVKERNGEERNGAKQQLKVIWVKSWAWKWMFAKKGRNTQI